MPSDILSSGYKTAAAVTDVGKKRDNNEDAVLMLDRLGCYAVSDGMGGGAAGEIASSTVVTYLRNAIQQTPLLPESRRECFREAVYAAHNAICAYASKRDYESMGATLAAILLNPWDPGVADLYHAGDSRIYRLRGRRLERLTTDHTVGNASGLSETQLPAGMSGLLSNVVGIPHGFFLTNQSAHIRKGDIFLICSDGLYRQITEEQLASDLYRAKDLQQLLDRWVKQAAEAGGIDNLSAVLIRFGSLPKPYVPTEDEVRENQTPVQPAAADSSDDEAETIVS